MYVYIRTGVAVLDYVIEGLTRACARGLYYLYTSSFLLRATVSRKGAAGENGKWVKRGKLLIAHIYVHAVS